MYVESESTPPAIEPLRVDVMTFVTTAAMHAVVAALRRDAMRVELVTADALQHPPCASVYVISLDVALAGIVAEKLVAWAASSSLRPGLIGVIDEGNQRACEALLAAGFDDAVATPLSARELAARVRAVHRRVHWKSASTSRLRFGSLTLDQYERSLWIDGAIILLTSIELAVVRELMKARGRPLSRVQLLDAAWGEGELDVSERAVDNVVLRLRRKLPRPELIETVRSVGFRLAVT